MLPQDHSSYFARLQDCGPEFRARRAAGCHEARCPGSTWRASQGTGAFRRETMGFRRFEMDVLLSEGTGDDRHRSCAVVPPSPRPALRHPATAGRKQGRMPREQALGGEGLVIVACRVKHHLDDALDVAVRRLRPPMSMPKRRAIDDRTCPASIEPLPVEIEAGITFSAVPARYYRGRWVSA